MKFKFAGIRQCPKENKWLFLLLTCPDSCSPQVGPDNSLWYCQLFSASNVLKNVIQHFQLFSVRGWAQII